MLLGACATSVETPLHPGWQARQTALSALHNWSLNGRLVVTNEQQGWHASLYWVQQGPVYAIDLIGPLGQGRVHIRGNGREVSLQTADGQVVHAADPEQLLEQAVGVRIPLKGLLYWVRGLPDPDQRSTALVPDDQGRLGRLEQGGWAIDYLDYTPVADLELPRRIRASQGDIKVQVVISEWSLRPS
jgi:outer membrane lipoprotein LolB